MFKAEIVTELKKISNKETAQEAVEILKQNFNCKNSIIITLGAEGVLVWDCETGSYQFVPARKVSAIDSTGAGDCFVGTLAHCLATSTITNLTSAVQQAAANATDSVLRRGTQYSFPHKLIPIQS